MKKIISLSVWFTLAALAAQAQNTISFSNNSTTRISTNSVIGGAATGATSSVGYRFALYCSTNATTVSGQTATFSGAAGNYAFNDPNWRLVAYGTNTFPAGQFVSSSANSSGATTIPGVTSGSVTRFVVIGWSGSAGANAAALEAWFNGGSPATAGWIGQSDVSGVITLGGNTTPATLFASNSPPAINGFTLGLVGTAAPVPPVITSQPVDQTVPSGNNAQFSVGATGTSLAYQWFFNSNAIAGATSSTFSILDAQATNVGYYSVSITNSVGSTNSFAASLTVNAPSNSNSTLPVITSQPADETATQGNTAYFSVSATGPSLAYQWFFNGSNLLSGATSHVLVISNAQPINAGSYSVLITNSAGSTNSFDASLTVNSSSGGGNTAPVIISQPANQTVVQGTNAHFSVTASGTSLAYQWFFNGSNVIAGATSSILTVYDVQSTNVGWYSVLITNAFGSTNSFGASLTLTTPASNTPPVITSQPADRSVPQGSTAQFSVSATGGSLAYQWYFNSSNRLAGATGSTLTIVNVQSTNAGNYSVSISNSAGSTNSAGASLTVTAATNAFEDGYVIFANGAASATKIFTNSAVGGPATGLTGASSNLYYYALYASSNADNVSGHTAAIVGSASTAYAFNDANWILVAYGVNLCTNSLFGVTNNYLSGQFASRDANSAGRTPVTGFGAGTSARFVVIGWSANVAATNIESVDTWFNGGSPASNGWIGQSAVSSSLELGNGTTIQTPQLFGTAAPHLQGFTLGLASSVPSAAYQVPYTPPAILQTCVGTQSLQLSWPAASGTFGVQSAPTPAGPWSDTGWTVNSDGMTASVTVSNPVAGLFYRLVTE